MICSVWVEFPGHINIEEAAAVIRYLRWVLRSSKRFRHRLVLLIDSKVALGAIAKGRFSSKPLNALVRRAAALFVCRRARPSLCLYSYKAQPG